MSDISEATVRGAVEFTDGTAGAFEPLFDFFDLAADFFAAARRLAAEDVVFFLVLVCDGSGTAATDARRITARMRSFRYSIEFG